MSKGGKSIDIVFKKMVELLPKLSFLANIKANDICCCLLGLFSAVD